MTSELTWARWLIARYTTAGETVTKEALILARWLGAASESGGSERANAARLSAKSSSLTRTGLSGKDNFGGMTGVVNCWRLIFPCCHHQLFVAECNHHENGHHKHRILCCFLRTHMGTNKSDYNQRSTRKNGRFL